MSQLKSDENYVFNWTNNYLVSVDDDFKEYSVGPYGAPLTSVVSIYQNAYEWQTSKAVVTVANAVASINGDKSVLDVAARHPWACSYDVRNAYTFMARFIDVSLKSAYGNQFTFTGWAQEDFSFFPEDYSLNPYIGAVKNTQEGVEPGSYEENLLNAGFDESIVSVRGKGLPPAKGGNAIRYKIVVSFGDGLERFFDAK